MIYRLASCLIHWFANGGGVRGGVDSSCRFIDKYKKEASAYGMVKKYDLIFYFFELGIFFDSFFFLDI